MKRVFEFKSVRSGFIVVFTITGDRDIFVRHSVMAYEHFIYDGNWEYYNDSNPGIWSIGVLLEYCLIIDRPLMEEMYDLLGQMGH